MFFLPVIFLAGEKQRVLEWSRERYLELSPEDLFFTPGMSAPNGWGAGGCLAPSGWLTHALNLCYPGNHANCPCGSVPGVKPGLTLGYLLLALGASVLYLPCVVEEVGSYILGVYSRSP